MSRPRNSNSLPETPARSRVLTAATTLFTQRGYAAATVREIVEAAGVTKPILYYYFGSKEGVYLEIVTTVFREFENLLDDSLHYQGSAWKRLLQLAHQTHSLFCARIHVARLVQSVYYGPPQGAPFFDFDVYHDKFVKTVLGMVKQGIKSREFRSGKPEYMTWAIIAAISLANELVLAHPDDGLGHQGLTEVLKLVFRGIVTEKFEPRSKRR